MGPERDLEICVLNEFTCPTETLSAFTVQYGMAVTLLKAVRSRFMLLSDRLSSFVTEHVITVW